MAQQISESRPPVGTLATFAPRVELLCWLNGRRELLVQSNVPAPRGHVIVADVVEQAAIDTSRGGFRVADCALVVAHDGTSGWVRLEQLSW